MSPQSCNSNKKITDFIFLNISVEKSTTAALQKCKQTEGMK